MIQNLIEKEGLKTKVRYSANENAFVFELKYQYILSIIRKRITIRNFLKDNVEVLAFDYTNLVYSNNNPKFFILVHLPRKDYPETLEQIIAIVKDVEKSNSLKEYFKNVIETLLK